MGRTKWQDLWAEEPSYAPDADTNPIADSEVGFYDFNLSQIYEGEAKLADDNQAVVNDVPASELDEQGFSVLKSKVEEVPVAAQPVAEDGAPSQPFVEFAPRGVLRFDSAGRKITAPEAPVRRQPEKPEPQRSKDTESYELRDIAYVHAFERVASRLRQVQEKSSRTRTAPWGNALGASSAKNDPKKWVRATDADWLCDIWLKARRTLSPRDFVLWRNTWYDCTVAEAKIPVVIRNHIKRELGKRFYFDRLADYAWYLQAQTLR